MGQERVTFRQAGVPPSILTEKRAAGVQGGRLPVGAARPRAKSIFHGFPLTQDQGERAEGSQHLQTPPPPETLRPSPTLQRPKPPGEKQGPQRLGEGECVDPGTWKTDIWTKMVKQVRFACQGCCNKIPHTRGVGVAGGGGCLTEMSQVWRLQVQGQVVSRVIPCRGGWLRPPFSLCLSASSFLCACLCSFPLFIRTPVILD